MPTRTLTFACLLLCAVAAAGCGATARLNAAGQVVGVTERDFSIDASPKQVSAGTVVFQARNRGPDNHELIVVRERAARLPLRSDGMTVTKRRLKSSIVGALEPGEPGTVRELRVHLTPGPLRPASATCPATTWAACTPWWS